MVRQPASLTFEAATCGSSALAPALRSVRMTIPTTGLATDRDACAHRESLHGEGGASALSARLEAEFVDLQHPNSKPTATDHLDVRSSELSEVECVECSTSTT
jgi:hypothetical protein